MTMSEAKRWMAIASVLVAGSCTEPTLHGYAVSPDPTVNHPIVVEQATKAIQVSFAPADAGLMPDDAARFNEFVSAYVASGATGTINVMVPSGPSSDAAIRYFGERLAQAGVSRDKIMVGTRDAGNGDYRVEIRYVGYVAHTDQCGNWTSDASDTFDNSAMPNFGCSVQQNIAAQVEDPRDIATPRALGPTDAQRRSTVIGNYQKGAVTSATKTADQSVAISTVQ
jgi:pilus assembly protein CpaD